MKKIADTFKFLWRNVSTRVWLVVTSVLLTLLLVITLVTTQNGLIYGTLKIVLGGERAKLGEFEGERHYLADYDSQTQALNAAKEFNVTVEEEGIVLLKNEDKALPFSKSAKVSVFGKNSVNLVYGGSGSSIGQGKMTDLYTALERAEIDYNPTLKAFYDGNKSGSGRGDNPAMGDIVYGFATGETPLNSYSATEWNSCEKYSDAAIFVVSRIGGEGFDLPRTMRAGSDDNTPVAGAASANDHYLQLDANERALLKELYNRFDKVVIILNTPGSFQLDFADDPANELYSPKLKSILWMGFPGSSGALAVGSVLCGDVTPSGHITDTYARNLLDAPAIANFGNNGKSNGNRYYYVNDRGQNRMSGYFVDYEEGIYVGYRYYETRGFGDEQWYKNHVVYPFGHGLSYTDFTWNVTQEPSATLTKDGKISVKVDVTNNGTLAGKDVVQLYYTAPYTAGGIEKPYVVLGGFAKTPEIKAGETKTVTVEMDVEGMKSYDYNDANGDGHIGYELESGNYILHVAHNAHDFEKSFTCNLAETAYYDNDKVTGAKVENRFDEVSSHIENYLTRNGWANMPTTPTDDERLVTSEFHSSLTWKKDDENKPWTSTETFEQGKEYGLELKDFIGVDYDDDVTVFTAEDTEKEILIGKTYKQGWELLLNQLTAEDMATLIGSGAFTTIKLDRVGKPKTNDTDGCSGITNFMSTSSTNTCTYAAESILGATWNTELAEMQGAMLGNEALLATKDGLHYTGWYAPAANIHRTAFGGRNWEYYSEDGFISGKMAAAVIRGCSSKGVYCYMKHFAVNDQETDRDSDGLITWLNEQSMREIYLKPFEIAVKEGKTTAMMSSFNRIGTVWAGGDYRLLTGILRNEWGFKGMIIDDYGLTSYINQEQVIRAGGDLMLIQGTKMPEYENASSTQLSCLRNATKHILYTVANSNIMEYNIIGMLLPVWVIALIVIDCAAAAGFAVWGYFVINGALKKKRAQVVETTPQTETE